MTYLQSYWCSCSVFWLVQKMLTSSSLMHSWDKKIGMHSFFKLYCSALHECVISEVCEKSSSLIKVCKNQSVNFQWFNFVLSKCLGAMRSNVEWLFKNLSRTAGVAHLCGKNWLTNQSIKFEPPVPKKCSCFCAGEGIQMQCCLFVKLKLKCVKSVENQSA